MINSSKRRTMATENPLSSFIIEAQKQTLDILAVYPPEKAFRISSGIYTEFTLPFTPCTTQIPSTVIFISDGIDHACTKLYDVLKTPDLQPPSLDSLEAQAQRKLKLLIIRTAFQHQVSRANLAQQCLKAVAGKQTEEGKYDKDLFIYKDVARLFPSHAGDWLNDLGDRFSYSQLEAVQKKKRHRHFFAILWDTQLAAAPFLPSQPQSRDDLLKIIHETFQKTYETIDLLGTEAFSSLLRQEAARDFFEYRKYTYSIRGLTLNNPNG